MITLCIYIQEPFFFLVVHSSFFSLTKILHRGSLNTQKLYFEPEGKGSLHSMHQNNEVSVFLFMTSKTTSNKKHSTFSKKLTPM